MSLETSIIQKGNENNEKNNVIHSTNEKKTNHTPISSHLRWGSRSVDIFRKIEQVGEGTYGKVYKAENKETKELVALKKIRMDNEKEGFPITAIREIKILKELHSNPNIVQLKEIVTSKVPKDSKGNYRQSGIYMVFEYMDHDLAGLMMSDVKLSESQIKCLMKQLLEGLFHCHRQKYLHRDIKGSNLLVNNKGQLKLADFGLARPYSEQISSYTNRVITLWYRPPELLLGAVQYDTAIDMWSVGCILVELLDGRPIFPGQSETHQIQLIYSICGTPDTNDWTNVEHLSWYKSMKPSQTQKRILKERYKHRIRPQALDLIDRLLTLDPKKRISASDALDHEYFWSHPLPCKPEELPKVEISSHEYQAKKRRGYRPLPPTAPAKRQKTFDDHNNIRNNYSQPNGLNPHRNLSQPPDPKENPRYIPPERNYPTDRHSNPHGKSQPPRDPNKPIVPPTKTIPPQRNDPPSKEKHRNGPPKEISKHESPKIQPEAVQNKS